ncbi:MAG TPA: alpha/beta fold hydrolase [Polyangiaceae bacterium]|nr:alpha/beta fold hydrolase [Polyangiaceae bacterium]
MKIRKNLFAYCLFLAPVVGCGVSQSAGGSVNDDAPNERLTTTSTPLQFGACPPEVAGPYPNLTCATLQVPLDYDQPSGEKITLTISKAAATNPAKRRGVALLNRGGPGLNGLATAGARANALPAVNADYDIIGFDPRGVGHSTPISCTDASFFNHPVPDPDSPATRDLNWKRSAEYAQACADNAGKYLPYMSMENYARDMDSIRVALGESKISYIGFSWGTYLGAVYSQLFPDKVAHMLFAGNMDPTPSKIFYQQILDQDQPAVARQYASHTGNSAIRVKI